MILAITTGTAHRWTTNNDFSDHRSFMVVLPFGCGFLVTLKIILPFYMKEMNYG
jgi:hypothetical protein